MNLSLMGVRALQLFMAAAVKEADKFGEAWVGSAVEYGPYIEWGTSVMQARPHWRVAINEMISELGGDQNLEGQIFEALLKGEAPMVVALRLERRVKQLITSVGAVDTGNYRGSIATGRTEESAADRSASLAINPASVS